MKPSVGRIVHYVLDEGERAGETRAAIVVAVFGERCNLRVFFDTPNDDKLLAGGDWRGSRLNDETTKAPGTWHWPPRV